MKILFVYSNITCMCTKKCTFDLARFIGNYCETQILYYKNLTNEIVKNFDIVVLQRIGTIDIIIKEDIDYIFKIISDNKENVKFIYMIDDLVLESQNGLPIDFIKKCYGVLCTSKTLAKHISQYNKNIFQFHTFIDAKELDVIPYNNYDKFTMAWVSTGGLGREIIDGIIKRKDELQLDFNLILIGGGAKEFRKINFVKAYPIVEEEKMIALIKGAQILLNPMSLSEQNIISLKSRCHASMEDFLNCKSEIKYAIAGITKACLLTTDIENYNKVITNRVNGIIIDNNINNWIDNIVYLYNNEKECRDIGINAYNNVKEEYDGKVVAKQIYDIFEKITQH